MTKDTTYKILLTMSIKMLVVKFSADEEENTTTTIKHLFLTSLQSRNQFLLLG